MDLIFRYFCFIAVGVQLLNLGVMRTRLSRPAMIFRGIFMTLFMLWGTFQLLGNYATPFFIVSKPFSEPFVACFWIIYFAFLWGTTAWVVWGNGATILAQSGLIRGFGPEQTIGVKVFFVAGSILVPITLMFLHLSGAFAGFP